MRADSQGQRSAPAPSAIMSRAPAVLPTVAAAQSGNKGLPPCQAASKAASEGSGRTVAAAKARAATAARVSTTGPYCLATLMTWYSVKAARPQGPFS